MNCMKARFVFICMKYYCFKCLPGAAEVVAGFGGSVLAFPKEEIPKPFAHCMFSQPTTIIGKMANSCLLHHIF